MIICLSLVFWTSDDTEETIKVRLEQFHANINAVKGIYKDVLLEVDGSGKPDEILIVFWGRRKSHMVNLSSFGITPSSHDTFY